LRRFRPQLIVGTGGYASACVVYTAARMGIPTLIHDLDAIPGRATHRLARCATRVTVGFPAAGEALGRPDAICTGNPVRPEIGSVTREQGVEAFGLDPARLTLLVLGGSQGARRLNEAVLEAVPTLATAHPIQVLHVTGERDAEIVREGRQDVPEAAARHYHLRAYLEGDMHLALAAADLALCRTGAATVSEMAAAGVPGIYVPYPFSMGGHQAKNAEHVVEAGGGVLVDDSEMTGPTLIETVARLLDGERLPTMSEAALRCGRRGAADEIARIAIELASEPSGGPT